MALQGTLDTFALPDVLRLLASTKKTGRLRVSGARGSGSVWVDAGGVVGTEASGAPRAGSSVEVVFELLRYKEGSFTFEADSAPPDPSTPSDVEPLLTEAEALLTEWREIEAVVPSLDSWVCLSPELPRADVVVDAPRWRVVVAVGSGATVGTLGEALVMGEVAVCRAVKDLVELGLGAVAVDAPGPLPAHPAHTDFSAPFAGETTTPARAELDALAGRLGADATIDATDSGLAPLNGFERFGGSLGDADSDGEHGNGRFGSASGAADGAPGLNGTAAAESLPQLTTPVLTQSEQPPPYDEEAEDADEVARQLANLSPKAARAVAAAAQAATDEERDAALAQVTGDDDEPINRGLLLKFLSSVRS